MNKHEQGVFPGPGTLTHSARTAAPQSLSAHTLIINGLWTVTSRNQYRGASVEELLSIRSPQGAVSPQAHFSHSFQQNSTSCLTFLYTILVNYSTLHGLNLPVNHQLSSPLWQRV